ncbi:hypothetical protein J4414_02785 [Candidatus Woesearchaeota archaeon]|nr:hypothetical protein [Candidatus Woesearchaeota archaeon]
MEEHKTITRDAESEELRKAIQNVESCVEELIRSPVEIKCKKENDISARLMLRVYINNCLGKMRSRSVSLPRLIDLKKDFEFTNIEYSQRTFGNLENSVQNYNSILEKLAND